MLERLAGVGFQVARELGVRVAGRSDVVSAPVAGPLPDDGRAGVDSKRRRVVRQPVGAGTDVDGGFVTGIVDLLFEHDGRIYFADWKSDRAHPFDDDALSRIVEERYARQARLYTLAICRILGIEHPDEYDEHFGGFFYFFVRGMSPKAPGRGIYADKVDWTTLVEFEHTLPDVVRSAKLEAVTN